MKDLEKNGKIILKKLKQHEKSKCILFKGDKGIVEIINEEGTVSEPLSECDEQLFVTQTDQSVISNVFPNYDTFQNYQNEYPQIYGFPNTQTITLPIQPQSYDQPQNLNETLFQNEQARMLEVLPLSELHPIGFSLTTCD